MADPLMDGLRLIFEKGNPPFDMIMWDGEQHTLAFRRAGDPDEWVNVWLHAKEDMGHLVERNGGSAGTHVLWEDGSFWPERGFVFNIPQRKQFDDVAPELRDRVCKKTFTIDS